MRSVNSLIRALVGSPVPGKRRVQVRASLAVESLEGRALPSATPLLPVAHHGADDVQHRRPEHGPEIQIEHGRVAVSGKAQSADDHGAHRQNDNAHDQNDDRGANRRKDGANDKNDDRGASRQAQVKQADDRGANRQNDNAHDQNDDRSGNR